MDPATLVILVAMGGLVSAFVAIRRVSGGAGGRAFRASDPVSLLVGGLLAAGAVAIGYLLVVGR